MSAAPASRAVVRQTRFLLRRNNLRHASTTAETASKAKDAASETASKAQASASTATSKASEGLTRVTSAASSAASGAATSASNAASNVQGRVGRYISLMQDTVIPNTIYYSRVGLELGRLVFKGQGMAPPSISHVQSYTQPLTNAVKNPDRLRHFITDASSNLPKSVQTPEGILSSVRNVNRQQLASFGVVAAEVLGFFTVGTMIGRLKIVGYHGEVHHEH